jgi:amino-acid N-acetyltransferase
MPEISLEDLAEADCAAVAQLISDGAQRGFLLLRTPQDIADFRDNFRLARVDGEVAGCVALREFGNGLEEVRTLTVLKKFCGIGVGSQLIQAAIELARSRGADTVFALTLRDTLFLRNGFEHTDRARFPQKVWADCRLCPRRDACDEIAVAIHL